MVAAVRQWKWISDCVPCFSNTIYWLVVSAQHWNATNTLFEADNVKDKNLRKAIFHSEMRISEKLNTNAVCCLAGVLRVAHWGRSAWMNACFGRVTHVCSLTCCLPLNRLAASVAARYHRFESYFVRTPLRPNVLVEIDMDEQTNAESHGECKASTHTHTK